MNLDLYGRKNLIKTKCAMCGCELMRRPDMMREKSFCNTTCGNAYRRGGVYITPELIDEVIELREQGWKLREIGEYLDVNYTTIWRLLNGK